MSQQVLTKQDFASDIDVKWCPGCGDYAILSAIQSTMPNIGVPKEKIVFVSGIGCSSRFPHYMSTYGFHTIHGRAPALATGLKLANPDLSVWQITGDGDALSIGGNHLMHALRRNIGIKILLFNNNIYGLTKGQASPASKVGTVTKSTPCGSIDEPINPTTLALAAGATFVARTYDKDPKHIQDMLMRASKHEGIVFIEILQNCVIFNDKVHDNTTSPQNKVENQLRLVHGEPMLFGKDNTKGIRLNAKTCTLETVEIGVDGVTIDDILVHDEKSENKIMQQMLGELTMPRAIGVLRAVEHTPYQTAVYQQIKDVQEKKGKGDLQKLLMSGDTWTIEEKN